jgi:hypothetical protein
MMMEAAYSIYPCIQSRSTLESADSTNAKTDNPESLETATRLRQAIRITTGITITIKRTMTSGPNVVEKRNRQTDRHGQGLKVFFTHAIV